MLQKNVVTERYVVKKRYVTKWYGYKTVTITKRYVLQNSNRYYGLGGRLL
jgi:hypothetical protein